MTNPNNAVGTNGAFGGRTSVNAFNDFMNIVSRGIISGWGCVPNSGLTVSLGGNGTTRDAAAAQDNAGNKTSINNISNSPINVTIGAAPGANSRIDAIVAYVDNPPEGSSSETDNPDPCGLIVVEGTVASTPVVPTEAQIRTGITADGASGTTAYYVVLAYITMASGTTDITSGEISPGPFAQIGTNQIADNSVTADKMDLSTLGFTSYSTTETNTGLKWIDNKPIYRKVFQYTSPADNTFQTIGSLSGIDTLVNIHGSFLRNDGVTVDSPRSTIDIYIDANKDLIWRNSEGQAGELYQVVEYTKS